MHICEFIPKKIIDNIAKNDPNRRVRHSYFTLGELGEGDFRKKRKLIQETLLKGGNLVPTLDNKSHTEHLKVFDNKFRWEFTKHKLWEEFIQKHTINEPVTFKFPKRTFTRSFDKVYDMFHDELGRESFDNDNAMVEIFLKFGVDYPNAFWDGEYLVFGAGDKYYFNDFSKIYDVMAHEYGHANIQYECNLQYENQSGALNEHIADVFGVCALQRKQNRTVGKSDWLIGKGLFTKRIKAKALRSFKDEIAFDDPIIGKDEQPKYMKDYVELPNTEDGDWGGVHLNSGIPNHAFYILNTKLGAETKSWQNGSLSVWYLSILKETNLSPYATFKEFAKKTIDLATISANDRLPTLIRESWETVGIL